MQRSGQSAAMMLAVRAPQSKPAMIAFSILSASIRAMISSSDCRLLAVAERFTRKKARRAIAAQIRDDHPVARRRQQRGDIDIAVNVVGPAVQKNDRRAIGRAGFGVSDIQDAGIDLLQRAERRVRPRLDRGQSAALSCRIARPQNRSCRAGRRQWSWPQCPRKRRRSWLISSDIFSLQLIQSRLNSLCRESAERERKSLHVRIEKFDLELSLSDGLRLSDQLIQLAVR